VEGIRPEPRDLFSEAQGRRTDRADRAQWHEPALVDSGGFGDRQVGTGRTTAEGESRVIRLVVSNQRGGVAKTTTAVNLARSFADRGLKTLLIDTDSQGSISTILGLRPQFTLHDFLIRQMVLKECVVPAHERIDVLCSDRKTMQAEDIISGQTLREVHFEQVFAETGADQEYEAVVIDVAPSLTLFQTCAMLYTKQVLIPAAMETLSVQGASASISSASELNRLFKRQPGIVSIGILPVMVNNRLQMTQTVMNALTDMSGELKVPLLPGIRTDTAVVKAARSRMFLADFDPKSKALEDYENAAQILINQLRPTAEHDLPTQVTS
jgi:chromosome partitioning protein